MQLTRQQQVQLIASLAAVKRGMQTPPEILDYFRLKELTPRFSWLDVWGEEHAHAFTVAGVTELRVLADFRAAIDKALAEGVGFEAFKADLKARLTPQGWWGPRQVSDPERRWNTKTVDFSRPGRLETTFWSNARAARAAGQWHRIQRSKQSRPYLLYVRSVAERKRPEHLAWAGTILPVDDPWWRSHYPPNGWGCKCSVQQLDQEDRDSYLAKDGYSDKAPDLGARNYVNARTGEVTRIPRGIDPGWHTNPGLARARTVLTQFMAQLEKVGPEAAKSALAKLWRSSWPQGMAKMTTRVHLPAAVSDRAQTELNANGPVIVVANDVIARKTIDHKRVNAGAFGLAQRIIDAGEWLDGGDPTNRIILSVIDGVHWVLAIRRSPTGYIQIKTLFDSDATRHAALRKREAALKAGRDEKGKSAAGGP